MLASRGARPVVDSDQRVARSNRVSPQSRKGVKLGELDRLKQENQALRDRLSRLSAASLRVSESLELETVLGEIVASARELTGAGSSGIVTIGSEGQMEDFITDGLAPEEHQRFLDHPRGLAIWEYLRQISRPLRLCDLGFHLSALGFPGDSTLARSFLGAPINHQGVHVGNFFLGDKETGQLANSSPVPAATRPATPRLGLLRSGRSNSAGSTAIARPGWRVSSRPPGLWGWNAPRSRRRPRPWSVPRWPVSAAPEPTTCPATWPASASLPSMSSAAPRSIRHGAAASPRLDAGLEGAGVLPRKRESAASRETDRELCRPSASSTSPSRSGRRRGSCLPARCHKQSLGGRALRGTARRPVRAGVGGPAGCRRTRGDPQVYSVLAEES